MDDTGKPWLLEVNSSPALAVDSEIDAVVKTQLLNDTFDLINFRPPQDYWVRCMQTRVKSQQIANRQKYEPRFIRTARYPNPTPLPLLKTPTLTTLVKFPPVQSRRRLTTRFKTRSSSRPYLRDSVETSGSKVNTHTQEDEELDFLMSVRKNMKSVKSYNTPGGDVAELQAAAEAAEPKPMAESMARLIEELTRTRPAFTPPSNGDRMMTCGNYELACPLDSVTLTQDTERSLLMLKQGKNITRGGQVVHQGLVAVIARYRDSV